jgi:hypothetical protein
MREKPRREAGQAAVETALTMPLFVFVLMGSLQLALMHQARLLTKYAAYKAARIGALTSADMTRMERAALAVLLPTIKQSGSPVVFNTQQASDYAMAFPQVANNRMLEDGSTKFVEVMVCIPNMEILANGKDEYDFDAEDQVGTTSGRGSSSLDQQSWKDFDRGRLSIQLTYNYRMIIPFADMMLYLIFTGQEAADLMFTIRIPDDDPAAVRTRQSIRRLNQLAARGIYVMPIRANYVMRMQSSLFPGQDGHKIPQKNECVLRFAKQGQGGMGSGGTTNDHLDDDDPVENPN